jgi:hypothetical protein
MAEYDVVTQSRAGMERVHSYTTEDAVEPGEVLRLDGRFWLVESLDEEATPPRAESKPARYRMRIQHPDGSVEHGAFRRWRPDAPRIGHSFSTLEDGASATWSVVDELLEEDDQGEPYLELVAERDYAELDEPPDHELEHALARRAGAADYLAARVEQGGALVELVALEPGEAPAWDEARRYIDDLILEEIEDDLLEQCGVHPNRDPRETWLGTVKERLRADLESFRADIEEDHDLIEEWDFQDGSIFAAFGTFDDESDPNSAHGWMCRLYDASALGAAGFSRVRKAELQVAE